MLLLTGAVMRWGTGLPDDWRTGATFAHDWLALAVVVVVGGHLWMAAKDPVARLGMRTGSVPEWWARAEHPAWVDGSAAQGRPDAGEE